MAATTTANGFAQLFATADGRQPLILGHPAGRGRQRRAGDGGRLRRAGRCWSRVRPSQHLAFSPLAMSNDTGQSWTPGLLDAALAGVPDALAVGASGRILALLHDSGIEQAPTAAAATAGQWSQLTTLDALAASAPGRRCGLAAVNAVSFGQNDTPVVAGSCQRRGVAGVFADSGGVWQAAGPTLPARFAGDQVQVLGLASTASGDAALLLSGADLLAAWRDGTRWTASSVLPVPAAGRYSPGRDSGRAGASGCCSARAAAGSRLSPGQGDPGRRWRPCRRERRRARARGRRRVRCAGGVRVGAHRVAAGRGGMAKVQAINVPIEYGSSGLGRG